MERGYPKGAAQRIADLQRSARPYRGTQAPTMWIYISQDRRGGWGYMDYENGWGDGDEAAPGQFCADEHGRIRLRGKINGGTVGTVAFTLPPGFWPAIPQRFVLANADSGYAIFDILTNGEAVVVSMQ